MGCTIGEALDRWFGCLRLAHQPHDLRQRRILPDIGRPHLERPFAVDRPTDHLASRTLGDGHRLPGDHGFVKRAFSLYHLAVDWDLLTRADEKKVSRGQHTRRDILHLISIQPVGNAWNELKKFTQCTGRSTYCTHLKPVSEEQHRYQGGDLPVEIDRLEGKGSPRGEQVPGGDGDAHQDRHVEHSAFEGLHRTLVERPRSVDGDQRR